MAELDDFFDKLKDIEDSVYSAKKALRLAKNLEETAKKALINGQGRLKYLKGAEYENTLTITALEFAKSSAATIYLRNLKTAVESAPEFNIVPFLTPLVDLANDEELFDIKIITEGCGGTISVILKMNEVAGNISDYANAVDTAREQAHIKEDRDPDKASKYWAEKIYPNKGSYGHVLGRRFAEFSTTAPYWSLLNDGNAIAPMSSNIGGTPYPENKATHFVENTEFDIKRLYEDTLKKSCSERSRLVSEVNDIIQGYEAGLERLYYQVDRINKNLDTAKAVEEYLRVYTSKDINPIKLGEAIDLAIAGAEGRVDIGKRGTRVRSRYSTLRTLMERLR